MKTKTNKRTLAQIFAHGQWHRETVEQLKSRTMPSGEILALLKSARK